LRIDLFLKLIGIVKTRMAGKKLCDTGKVFIKGKPLKPSHELQAGDRVEIRLPFKEMTFQVLDIPLGKSLAKADRSKYFSMTSIKET